MKIQTEVNISASAEAAWLVIVNQYGDLGNIISALKSSSLDGPMGVGVSRVCNTTGIGPFPSSQVRERLTELNPKLKTLTYEVTHGLPSIFTHAQNTWSVTSVDENNCIIHSHAEVRVKIWLTPLSWILPTLLKKDIKKTFDEIRFFIETGDVHPRKIAITT